MANTPNELKFQNIISLTCDFAWIPSGTQNKRINPKKELANKHKGYRR
jgi:hypothetical protein